MHTRYPNASAQLWFAGDFKIYTFFIGDIEIGPVCLWSFGSGVLAATVDGKPAPIALPPVVVEGADVGIVSRQLPQLGTSIAAPL
jgi:hypothetical protein